MVTKLAPTDDDVETISEEVGMSPGGWDAVNPKEIITAAWKLRDRKPATALAPAGMIEVANSVSFEAARLCNEGGDQQPLYGLILQLEAAIPAAEQARRTARKLCEAIEDDKTFLSSRDAGHRGIVALAAQLKKEMEALNVEGMA